MGLTKLPRLVARMAGLALLSATLLTVVSLPAHAGGGTWMFNGKNHLFSAFAPGQEIVATSNLWLPMVREEGRDGFFYGGPQHAPFYGWIVARPNPGSRFPPPLPDDAVQVGEVVFKETQDPKVMDLSLSFEMPELAPGDYGLVVCNEGCERQIGDLWMTSFTVVEDPGQAFLATRVAKLEMQMRDTRYRLKDKIGDLATLRRVSDSRIASLEDEIAELERQPAAAPTATRSPLPVWPLVATGIFVALALVALLRPADRRPRLEI